MSRIITDDEILDDIGITPDHAPNLSDGMGAGKNWRPATSGGVSAEYNRTEYRQNYRTTTPINDAYSHAIGADMPMSILASLNGGPHIDEADRIALLYQSQRNFYEVKISFEAGRLNEFVDAIGQTFQIQSDRFNFGARNMILVGVRASVFRDELLLTFWG